MASTSAFAYDYSHLDAGGTLARPPELAVGSFGEKLRKQREQRNIALDAISNTTKISTRMLRALEDEHFDQLPGGVFNKGFVRAYARQVGLDEEEAIADYLAALRESQIQAQSILPDFRDVNNHNLRGNDLRRNDLAAADLHGSDLYGNDPRQASLPTNAAADRGNQLLRDDRRKQGRRNEDRPDPRHNDDRDAGRGEDHRPKDLPSLHDPAARARADHPASERFRQKYPAGSPGQSVNQPSNQVPWGKLAVGLLCLTLVLALWNSHRHAEPTAAVKPAVSRQPSSNQALASAPAPASPATQRSGSATSPKAGKAAPAEILTLSSGKTPPGTISPTAPSPATSPAITLSAAPPTSQSSLQAAPTAPSQAGIATKPATIPSGTSASVAKVPVAAISLRTFTLLIRAEKTTWVSIAADGKPVAEETLIAPAHTSVRATGEVIVKAGNAAGVSFQLNGKDVPAEGNEGEVKTFVFDATGLRAPPVQPTDTNRE